MRWTTSRIITATPCLIWRPLTLPRPAGPANLVILPNVLTAGATYTIELRAAFGAGVGRARIRVVMNRPPYGGSCTKSHELPAVALRTPVQLSALQWFDDVEDLPLMYGFSFAIRGFLAKDAVPLREQSIVSSMIWQRPSAGNFTIFCVVADTHQSIAQVEVELDVQAASLEAADSRHSQTPTGMRPKATSVEVRV